MEKSTYYRTGFNNQYNILHTYSFIFIYEHKLITIMGQEISKSYTPPPLTLRDCLVDGQIDLTRYRLYARRVYDNEYTDEIISQKKRQRYELESKKRKVIRSVKRHHIEVRKKDGSMRKLTFEDSTWYNLYINSAQDSDRK